MQRRRIQIFRQNNVGVLAPVAQLQRARHAKGKCLHLGRGCAGLNLGQGRIWRRLGRGHDAHHIHALPHGSTAELDTPCAGLRAEHNADIHTRIREGHTVQTGRAKDGLFQRSRIAAGKDRKVDVISKVGASKGTNAG